ncbi:hypothetical protein CsSME_00013794 [Camellia sinensis var. sinensis]
MIIPTKIMRESVEKLIKLLSQSQQQQQRQEGQLSANSEQRSTMEIEMDCRAVADVAVTKFKRVISLLGRTRTGHARFRGAPLALPVQNQNRDSKEVSESTRIYCPRPIQQVPLAVPHPNSHHHHLQSQHDHLMIVKNGVIDRKDSALKSINFSSYSPAISGATTSFMSSLTGDTDSKQLSSSSAFQISNLSQVSSAGKPPLLKRKCSSSENAASGKCSGSSGRCHCSKRRKLRLKRVCDVGRVADIIIHKKERNIF